MVWISSSTDPCQTLFSTVLLTADPKRVIAAVKREKQTVSMRGISTDIGRSYKRWTLVLWPSRGGSRPPVVVGVALVVCASKSSLCFTARP